MRVWSSLFVPGGGPRRQVQAAAARRPGPRPRFALRVRAAGPPAPAAASWRRGRQGERGGREPRPVQVREGAFPRAAARGPRCAGDGVCGGRGVRGAGPPAGTSPPGALRPAPGRWAARPARSRGGLRGGGAWRSGRAVRPGRDRREAGGAQPGGRWRQLEARAGGLAPPASLGSRRARAWGSGVRGYAVAPGQNRQQCGANRSANPSSPGGAPHTYPAPCRPVAQSWTTKKFLLGSEALDKTAGPWRVPVCAGRG